MNRIFQDSTPPKLGTGSTSAEELPVKIDTDHTYEKVSTGRDHACGLRSDGDVTCWGSYFSGQLGAGQTAYQLTPAPISSSEKFVDICTGKSFSCGVSIGGDAYCWGDNNYGQLGTAGATGLESTPVLVLGGIKYRSISCSGELACALSQEDDLYCWGRNNYGQVGTGKVANPLGLVPTVY